MPKPDNFEVLGPELPGKAPRSDVAEVDANIDRARNYPGQWCIAQIYKAAPTASSAAKKYREKYPDAQFESRRYRDKPTMLVRWPADDDNDTGA